MAYNHIDDENEQSLDNLMHTIDTVNQVESQINTLSNMFEQGTHNIDNADKDSSNNGNEEDSESESSNKEKESERIKEQEDSMESSYSSDNEKRSVTDLQKEEQNIDKNNDINTDNITDASVNDASKTVAEQSIAETGGVAASEEAVEVAVTEGAKGAVAKSAASGGVAVAGSAAAAGSSSVIGTVACVIAIIFIFSFAFNVLYSYLMPQTVSKVVGQFSTNVFYTITDTGYQAFKTVLFALNPFESSPTSDKSLEKADVDIPVEYDDYNPNNEQDMALLEEYKLFAVALSRAYDNSLDMLESKCKEYGYDYDLTLETIESKYPNGWKDVYKDVNYADLVVLFYFYMQDDVNTWENMPTNYFDELYDKYINGITEDSGETTYTFTGMLLGKIEDLILKKENAEYLYQMGFTVKQSGDIYYLDIEIKPYCWNQLYDLIGKDPEGLYDESVTYADMMESMTEYLKAVCEDSKGKEKPICKLLGMDKDAIVWTYEFEANDISNLYASINARKSANEYNRTITYTMLRAAGYDNFAASGICGNLSVVNAFNTGLSEDKTRIGIANWDINTKGQELKSFASNLNANPESIYVQTAFLIHDLKENSDIYKTTLLNDAENIQDATDYFCINYATVANYASKDEWQGSGNSAIWERFTYSKLSSRYHLDLKDRREAATDAYWALSEIPIMLWPVPSSIQVITDYGTITNAYGITSNHNGIDIKADENSEVIATASGTVVYSSYDAISGNYIIIDHNGTYRTEYKHLSDRTVNVGDIIIAGDIIGHVGKTGSATESHLHFAVKETDASGNSSYISPWEVTSTSSIYGEIGNELIEVGRQLIGKITYEWGGKPRNAGWNERWNTPGTGLDCSGFVQWVYWTALGEKISGLGSTYAISSSQPQIAYEELQPGDLGMLFHGGTYYLDAAGNRFPTEIKAMNSNKKLGYPESDVKTVSNHVGIYVGKDEEGHDLWLHCTGGSKRTVVEERYTSFKCFYRVERNE